MNTKDLLRSLTNKLEVDSQFENENFEVKLQNAEAVSKATILVSVEGKTRMFEVFARDLGFQSLSVD